MKVVFDHSEEVAHRIRTFWFKPDKPVRYIAGQFTQIHLPHPDTDERGDKRWFTLSSSPTDPMVSITTKFAAENGSSFKRMLAALKPGTKLNLADPMGDFVLPKDIKLPLLFAAAGMGITPMHSMIKWLKDTDEQRQIQLIHAVNKSDELAWRDLFESHGLNFTPIVKEPGPNWQGGTGQLSAMRIAEIYNDSPAAFVYISGPEPMIEDFFKQLPPLGIAKDKLVTDYFPGYAPI